MKIAKCLAYIWPVEDIQGKDFIDKSGDFGVLQERPAYLIFHSKKQNGGEKVKSTVDRHFEVMACLVESKK